MAGKLAERPDNSFYFSSPYPPFHGIRGTSSILPSQGVRTFSGSSSTIDGGVSQSSDTLWEGSAPPRLK